MYVLAKLFHIEGDVSDVARLLPFASFICLLIGIITQNVTYDFHEILGMGSGLVLIRFWNDLDQGIFLLFHILK